jgi:DNA helicase-2/ATP-dependent DNA helicase PcrA
MHLTGINVETWKDEVPGKPFQTGNQPGIKSSSIREEPQTYVKDDRFKKFRKTEPASGIPFTASDSSLFSEGDTVQHERFGTGVIVSIEGQPPNTTATVEFEKDGSKKLLLRFAKLKKL